MSLRFRFLAILISLTLIPIVVAGALVGWRSYKSQQWLVKAYHREIVSLAAERISTIFDQLGQELTFMAASLDPARRTPNQVRLALAQSLSRHQNKTFAFSRLAVLDNLSRVMVGLSQPQAPPDSDWLLIPDLMRPSEVLPDAEIVYGPVRLLQPSGAPVITMARPIISAITGALEGWLTAQIRIDQTWNRLSRINQNPEMAIYMIDSTNRLVAHPDPDKVKTGIQIQVGEGQTTGPGSTGARALISATAISLGQQSFKIVAEQNWYQAFRPIWVQVVVMAGLVLVAIVGIALAAILLFKDVIRPVEKLSRAALRMGGGDLTARVESGRGDEIGHLSGAFNTMASRLEENMAALRKQVDERALAYKRLDRSYLELEDFTHVASHHLQEPLRKMASFGELLHKRYHPELDERGKRYLWYIINGSTRLKALLEDLLTYSQLGRAELMLTKTDLDLLMAETVAQLQPVAAQRNARITWENLPTVIVDRPKFQIVIKAIVDNALKFCDHETPEITISGEIENDQWALNVIDNGSGVEPAYQDQIFGLFKTLHQAGKYPGTGIGLALCRRIIERHNGRLWIESQPGQGSTFRMTLPLRPGGKR